MGDLLIVQNQIIQHWNLLLSLIICCTKFILYARPNFCKLCELKETHHLNKLFGLEIYYVSKKPFFLQKQGNINESHCTSIDSFIEA